MLYDIINMKEIKVSEILCRDLTKKELEIIPSRIWVLGDISKIINKPTVGIIGNREMSSRGKHNTEELTLDVIKKHDNNIVIVTGLARGIDRTAHDVAIRNKTPVISVLGTPIPKYMNPENKNHVIISQFPPGTRTIPTHFLDRNKLIAILCNRVIIIEAQKRGGGTMACGWNVIRLQRKLDIFHDLDKFQWVQKMLEYDNCRLI